MAFSLILSLAIDKRLGLRRFPVGRWFSPSGRPEPLTLGSCLWVYGGEVRHPLAGLPVEAAFLDLDPALVECGGELLRGHAVVGQLPAGSEVLEHLGGTPDPSRRYADGAPGVGQTPERYPQAPLLAPISELRAVWRDVGHRDLERTSAEQDEAGYRLTWAWRS